MMLTAAFSLRRLPLITAFVDGPVNNWAPVPSGVLTVNPSAWAGVANAKAHTAQPDTTATFAAWRRLFP
ncbi:hypothetical protein [Amycolatopsis sp. NPDC051371]|uniref:hypothetical protein n=1 Tax=Amycolatopsis sp. NPDC051371 TaxID=3155800 RepID=UPI0034330EF7